MLEHTVESASFPISLYRTDEQAILTQYSNFTNETPFRHNFRLFSYDMD